MSARVGEYFEHETSADVLTAEYLEARARDLDRAMGAFFVDHSQGPVLAEEDIRRLEKLVVWLNEAIDFAETLIP